MEEYDEGAEKQPETEAGPTSLTKQIQQYAQALGISDSKSIFMISVLQTVCGLALLVAYIFVGEPLTYIFVENRRLRWKVQATLVRVIERVLTGVYDRAFDLDTVGLEHVNPEKLAIVTSNHQSLLDYLTIMRCGALSGLDSSVFFFVWKHCVRMPSLSVLYNQWLKKSNWRIPNVALPDVFSAVLDSPWREAGGKWVVIFPEVTPWSVSYMLEHRAECAENGCPKLQNLLYPRFNAFVQTVSFLRDYPVADVYDFTITYVTEDHQIGIPTWYDLMFSQRNWKVHVEVKRIGVSSLPHKEKHLTRWLEKQWYEKDQGMSEYKRKLAEED